MYLCGTRRLYAGFGSTAGIPSTCLQDVVLLPLPTFLLLLALPLTMHIYATHTPHNTRTRTPMQTRASVVYSCLSAVIFVMLLIEIVRLNTAARGIGLLPICAVGMLLALALHHGVPCTPARVVLLVYWALMTTFTALQIGTLVVLARHEPRRGTRYPATDQITDVGVLLALYVLMFMLEVLLLPRNITRPMSAHAHAEHRMPLAPLIPPVDEQRLPREFYIPPTEFERMQAISKVETAAT